MQDHLHWNFLKDANVNIFTPDSICRIETIVSDQPEWSLIISISKLLKDVLLTDSCTAVSLIDSLGQRIDL